MIPLFRRLVSFSYFAQYLLISNESENENENWSENHWNRSEKKSASHTSLISTSTWSEYGDASIDSNYTRGCNWTLHC